MAKSARFIVCAGAFSVAGLTGLVAQEPPSPAVAADAGPMPANTPVTDVDQTPSQANSQNLPDQTANPNDQSGTSSSNYVPPVLPQTGTGITAFSPTSTEPQSSMITTPSLFTTGSYDLSQVAATNAMMQAYQGQAAAGFLSEGGIGHTYGPIQRIKLGPVDMKFALNTSIVSDDNFLAQQGSNSTKESDVILTVSPSVMLEYGNHEGQKGTASIIYSPQLNRYFHHSSENSLDQNVSFNAGYDFQRLSLNVGQSYAQVTGINQDSNARTTQTSQITTFGGNYNIDDKFAVTSHVQHLETSYSGGGGQSDEINSVNTSLLYHLSDKMTLGPSVNVGEERPQGGTKQNYEQALLGLNYQLSPKIGLYGQGGAEFRQYSGFDGATNPLFSAGINYTPMESTVLSLNGYQNIQASSADSAQTVVNVGFGASVTQRLFQRFFLGFSFNYDHADYQANAGASSASSSTAFSRFSDGSRQENYVYRPSLSFAPTEWTSIALYYQYRANETNSENGGYHDNQMGVSVSAQF